MAEILATEQGTNSILPRFDEYCYFLIGSEKEKHTVITARDCHPTQGRVPWSQQMLRDDTRYDNSFWAVDIVHSGQYEFTLRRFPKEANGHIGTTKALLKIGEVDMTKPVLKGATAVTFRLDLKTLQTQLQTWFTDEQTVKTRGAYYVYVKCLTERRS